MLPFDATYSFLFFLLFLFSDITSNYVIYNFYISAYKYVWMYVPVIIISLPSLTKISSLSQWGYASDVSLYNSGFYIELNNANKTKKGGKGKDRERDEEW